jgi:hypothetical protein
VFSLVKDPFHNLLSRTVARKIFLGIRIDPELKKALEELGNSEERSVSQICELLLRKGVDAYKSEGSKYLHRGHPRQKKESSE